MNRYEREVQRLTDEGIDVDEYEHLGRAGVSARSSNGQQYIAVAPYLTTGLKQIVLAHEEGHLVSGSSGSESKDEARADRWASNFLLSPQTLLKSILRGCRSINDLSEYLNLPPDFLEDAIKIMRIQYGNDIEIGQYRLYLHPIEVEDIETGQVWPEE